MQVERQQLELDMKQQTGSISGQEFVKAVYCHPAYLTYMQSTCCEMLDCMKHKVESRFPGEISIASNTQIYHTYGRKWRRLRSILMKVKKREWKSWLKAQHSANNNYGIWPHHFMANRWGNNGNSERIYIWVAPKSMLMVTAAMKLKDAFSLEEKLWPN